MGTIKKVFFLLLILSVSLYSIEWVSYDKAKVLQKKNHKPIMLDVMRDTCHYCKKMDKEVFENKEMAQWLQERFILVQVNLDEDLMPIDEEVTFTPTFYFLDENGKILKKIPGSWNIQDFKDLTRKIK
jgi:thioredoxin-related protein